MLVKTTKKMTMIVYLGAPDWCGFSLSETILLCGQCTFPLTLPSRAATCTCTQRLAPVPMSNAPSKLFCFEWEWAWFVTKRGNAGDVCMWHCHHQIPAAPELLPYGSKTLAHSQGPLRRQKFSCCNNNSGQWGSGRQASVWTADTSPAVHVS